MAYTIPLTLNRIRASQIAAQTEDDYSDCIVNEYGELVLAGYDWTAGAINENLTHVGDIAVNVNGGNRDAGTQTVTLADDDPAVVDLAAIEILQTTIAGDTTSIDGKTPALGSAAEAASVPVTVATDDPHYGAVGAAADVDGVIHGQLRYTGEAAAAIQTAVEVMDDWDNAASDGASVSGDTAHDAADAGEPVKVGARARTSQITAVANNDRTDLVANAYGEQVNAGYDWSTDANRVEEVNPLPEQYASDKLVETNITTNTTNYHYIDFTGYRNITIQGQTSGTAPTDVLTVTVEATVQDDGTAAASCDYQDVTFLVFSAVSWVDTDFIAVMYNALTFKYFRVKYVTSNGGGNDCDLTLYIRKAW